LSELNNKFTSNSTYLSMDFW